MAAAIRLYSDETLPKTYRAQILEAKNWRRMCRSSVPYSQAFTVNALKSAQIIVVAVLRGRVVGFLLGLTSSFLTTLDGRPARPVCRPDELYLDVVCADPEMRGAGWAMIHRFYRKAQQNGKKAIRLYATEKAQAYWEKHGFLQCEKACTRSGCSTKRYKTDYNQGVRMTGCLKTLLGRK